MASSSVFDFDEIAKRVADFPFKTKLLPDPARRDMFGSAQQHCEICPLKDGESCTMTCSVVRENLKDGIKVTFASRQNFFGPPLVIWAQG